MTPEGKVTQAVKKYLDKREGVWYFKVHGHLMQKSGVPDLIVCYRGKFVGFELKSATGKREPLQIAVADDIIRAGGVATVARCVEDVMVVLDMIDTYMVS